MFAKSVETVLSQISKDDVVLDIGGWVQPFNRANHVVDILPYETRGIHGSIGEGEEQFSKDTWHIHDVSGGGPLPFSDKEIDYVVCSHVLEDIRDPLRLCSEMIRVAKRGYIEVPSRRLESVMGLEGKGYAGYYHHRWLIQVDDSMTFRFKPHLMHSSWKYHLPSSFQDKLDEEARVSFLFWEDSFDYRELIQVSHVETMKELEEFVKEQHAYPTWRYRIDMFLRRMRGQPTGKSPWDGMQDIVSR